MISMMFQYFLDFFVVSGTKGQQRPLLFKIVDYQPNTLLKG